MKFSCSKESILDAVSLACKAASSKSTIKALEGLLLELENNNLTITGYNLEIGIRTSVSVSDGEDGSIVINASMLSNIIRKMPAGIIKFEIGDDLMALISIGRTEMSLMCIRADEYPPVPQTNAENGLVLSQRLLKSMISQTRYACSTVDTKPALTGCLFEQFNNELNVAATDGIRIALRREPVTYEDIKFIVPARTLDELVRLLSDKKETDVKDDKGDKEDKDDDESKENENSNVTVCIDKNQISFQTESYTMISRLINGDFLDYKKHLSSESEIVAEINTREIIEVLERVMLLINDKNKVPIRCGFRTDSLDISCTSSLGKINDRIGIKYNGDPIDIGFNARFLLEAFRAADSDRVRLKLGATSTLPVMILPIEGEEFKFFLLPMRLK